MNPTPETPSSDLAPDAVASAFVESTPSVTEPRKTLWQRIGSRQFLFVSILIHVLFGLVATVFIVQTITTRKLTFVSAPPSPNRSKRATEHSVQMAQKRKTMSAPAQSKRVTTTAVNTKVAMPSMPALSSVVTPAKMAGMMGTGFGMGASGGGGTGGSGGGGPVQFFGFRGGGKGLAGTFYDLKQSTSRQPTKMTPQYYAQVITNFIGSNFSADTLSRFYASDKRLYATSFWIPLMPADRGPAAFQLEGIVQPRMWCVWYKGRVTAPESFTFHFVGAGDDLMLVKFDGKLVLSRNADYAPSGIVKTQWQPQANYDYGYAPIPKAGFAKGDALKVEAGKSYPIEVVIGEQPGGESWALLMQEIDGVQYDRDGRGNPVLPVFRMSDAKPASNGPGIRFPPHRDDGPIWQAEPAAGSSIFDH